MRSHAFSVSYPDGFVLSVDEFEIEKGKIYSLIGANGCGKSTFLRALAGAVKTVEGVSPLPKSISVTYLPQKPYAFRKSVISNLLLAGGDRGRAMSLLRELGIESLAERKASRLSGGETARMALARCLMADCDLLLLDEPTAAMDIEATVLAEQTILRARESLGCAVLLVTHSPAQASRIADTTLFFRSGKIAEIGATKELLTAPKNPETKRFLEFSGV